MVKLNCSQNANSKVIFENFFLDIIATVQQIFSNYQIHFPGGLIGFMNTAVTTTATNTTSTNTAFAAAAAS